MYLKQSNYHNCNSITLQELNCDTKCDTMENTIKIKVTINKIKVYYPHHQCFFGPSARIYVSQFSPTFVIAFLEVSDNFEKLIFENVYLFFAKIRKIYHSFCFQEKTCIFLISAYSTYIKF